MKNIPIKAKGEPRKVPYLQRCLLYNWFNKKIITIIIIIWLTYIKGNYRSLNK